jgi:DNA repair photolyase
MNTPLAVPTHRVDHSRRTRTEIVDQHATWIAVNPVQGCPKVCSYCFLNERGQTAVRPEQLASPAETVNLLTASPFYAPDRPVALYTWTDVMALPSSRAHLADLLALMVDRQIPNPIVLITKCQIPDDALDAVTMARRAGLRTIVYLSYSGLGREMERGIRHEELKANFPRLAQAGVPVVHYWRPAFPESATPSTMEAVFDWAAAYAQCTVAAGLKVEPAALPRLAGLWPELASTPGVTAAECVYPQAFWDFIHATNQRRPDYPLFHTNSCALAYVLGHPDRFGVFRSTVCTERNHCPTAQRRRCEGEILRQPALTEATVRTVLVRRGHGDADFTLDHPRGEVVIHAVLPTSAAAALTQDLGIRVRIARQHSDPYWSSGTAGALSLVIGDAG